MTKKNSLALVITTCLIVATASIGAYAQTSGTEIVVTVKFAFVVGERTLPAGSYRIAARTGSPAGLAIQAVEGKENAIVPVLTRLARRHGSAEGPGSNLVFDKVGDQMFLSEVWLPERDGYLVRGTADEHQHAVVDSKR